MCEISKRLANKLEVHKCALCYDAPCKKMYKNIDPERIIRAIRFDNKKGARTLINDINTCHEKNTNCDEKCPLNIDIDMILDNLIDETSDITDFNDIDISTEICGVKLENPFMLSSWFIKSKIFLFNIEYIPFLNKNSFWVSLYSFESSIRFVNR